MKPDDKKLAVPCECPVAGYCNRFGRRILGNLWKICQGTYVIKGQTINPETRLRYLAEFDKMPKDVEVKKKIEEGCCNGESGDGPIHTTRTIRTFRELNGGGPGTELVELLEAMPGMKPCGECYALAKKMNQYGVAGCREHLDFIVESMLPRAEKWWNKSSPWMKLDAWFASQQTIWERLKSTVLAATDVDAALRESIRIHVEEAIRRDELRVGIPD